MSDIYIYIRKTLAQYTEIPVDDFDMAKDLDLDYDMDSTELIEIALDITKKYNINITKSHRNHWNTGNDIVSFIKKETLNSSNKIVF